MSVSLPGVGIFGTSVNATTACYLLKSAGFRIEAIWGRTREDAKKIATLLDIPFTTTQIDDLLLNPRVDLVWISSPPHLQSEIAVKTLGIGKNMLCERPAGLSCEDTDRMLTKAKYYPSLMSIIAYYLRFLPTVCELKKQIAEKYIGDMTIIEIKVRCSLSFDANYGWSHDSRMGGGVLALFGSHFVDLVHYISGQKAVKVHGFVRTFQKQTKNISGFREITSDDFCTFEMQLNKNAFCTCVINNNVPGPFSYEVLVIGTKACLLVKDGMLYGQSKSNLPENKLSIKEELLAEDDRTIPSGLQGIFSRDVLEQIPIPFVQGLLKFIESFKRAFRDEGDGRKWDKTSLNNAATFEDALYVQHVLACIRKSSQTSYWEQV